MGSLQNEKTTAPATSPSHSAETHDSATNNLNNLSPVIQRLQSPSSLFATPRLNLDRQTSYPRWSQQPQLPGSEISSQALSAPNTPQTSTPSYDHAQCNRIEYQIDSYDRSKFNPQYTNADAAVKLNQSIPQKKRKKSNEDDDCKHCNCKKTNCLKLYCECFSSGYYCAKTCSCQECYNTPEYEDTVQESREHIEIRNPLAFAPKVGDGIFSTPSGKYRRGCTCKKTMCQKKYCECYQSNIGCTSVCRCEGCENVYGKKEDYSKRKEMLSKRSIRHISGITFDEKLQNAATQNNLPQTELQNPYILSSLTSSFPYIQSPASNLDLYSPYGKSPQFYQNFGNSPTLSNSRNYSEGGNVPKRLNLQKADTSELFLPEYRVLNSFDPNNVSNYLARPIPSNNYLPFSDSQCTQIPPFGENIYFRNKNGGYTPPDEVKSISSSPQGQMFNSSTSLRSARNVPLPSVHLFPPLSPLVDRKDNSSGEKKGDNEDIVSEKRR